MEKGKNGPILRCENIGLRFGGVNALVDITFEVNKGEVLSIIGPNGAGKTCIINTITGFYHPWKGKVYLEGQEITALPPHKICTLGIARTFQNIELFTGLSVLDNLLAARHIYLKTNLLSNCLYFGFAQKREIDERKIVEDIIDFLEMEAIRKQEVKILPYGQRKRVELGRALALEPKIILLDEPTAGMNLEEKEDMVRFILDINEEKGTTIILVEHDMDIVMDISDRIIVFDFGNKIAEGIPDEIKKDQRVIKAYLGEK
ncbi:MAG: ABC transporter ATP-binding protein [Syntrophaceae bacterium]|nr:ABC transporter ATP-binding protein [Syntrophaceae bacterium]